MGDARRAIGYYEQQLAIARELGDQMGEAIGQFNIANLYVQQGTQVEAATAAETALSLFQQMGHTAYAQQATQLLTQLQDGSSGGGSDPSPAQILAISQPLIEAVVAAAHGHQQARQVIETSFEQLTEQGWQIADLIHRIWAGERDAAALTIGINQYSALVIQAILQQLLE